MAVDDCAAEEPVLRGDAEAMMADSCQVCRLSCSSKAFLVAAKEIFGCFVKLEIRSQQASSLCVTTVGCDGRTCGLQGE